MAIFSEPMSEDDYPEDIRIVSTQPFKIGNVNVSLNYIRKDDQSDFKPLNAQIGNSDTTDEVKDS